MSTYSESGGSRYVPIGDVELLYKGSSARRSPMGHNLKQFQMLTVVVSWQKLGQERACRDQTVNVMNYPR